MQPEGIDRDVYRLALAGYVGSEICELLDIREREFCAALERLADWLVPTAPSRVSIDPADCLPFVDELWR